MPVEMRKFFDKGSRGRVLLDSGANEVVRPFSGGWMGQIMGGIEVGMYVTARLAGGVEVYGL